MVCVCVLVYFYGLVLYTIAKTVWHKFISRNQFLVKFTTFSRKIVSMTPHHQKMNKASQALALADPSLLNDRPTRLARMKVDEDGQVQAWEE